jgi:HPt (histidine-containing phosphotransfer) domain-containing protein
MAENAQTRTKSLIADLWRKNQPQILDRIALLEAAAAAAQSGTLSEAERTEAESMAHKLAGSLGMFGYPTGTTLARALEDEFGLDSPDPAVLSTLTRNLRTTLFPPAES